jgi:putative FmdB family regulatory protein
MPIFDYVCGPCGQSREILTLTSKENPVYCIKCNEEMSKAMPAPGLLVTNFHDKPSVKTR